jgi:KipI family sensor histidine kinase inhibitor
LKIVSLSFEPVFHAASDQALLVTLGEEIGLPVHRRVVQLLHAVEEARIPGVVNLHPAYCSLLIRFNSLATGHVELEAEVRTLAERLSAAEPPAPRVVAIPVRYGGEFGPDLGEVAELCRMTPAQVIETHAGTLYTVYFLGFVPGFAYMGRVPASLMVPRLARPRKHVPAGSVAIANDHTAIYSISTPGGWRLIGRTEVKLFDPYHETLSMLQTGDEVRFCPIS